MPTYNYSTNPETLLLLAWCSTLDLPALLQKDQQARPHKYPERADLDGWLPAFPEDMLSEQIMEALSCFQDGFYDPVFLNLVKYRLQFVDVEEVAGAIGLNDLTKPWHGLFYSDHTFENYTVEKQRAKGPANETAAFLEAVSEHTALQERLMSQTSNGSVCQSACAMQAFFAVYPRLRRTCQDAPFFVREFLFMSLARVNWHVIAAHLLCMEPPPCTCTGHHQQYDPTVQVALFEALLNNIGGDLQQVAKLLPDQHRDTALFLSNLCDNTAHTCTSM